MSSVDPQVVVQTLTVIADRRLRTTIENVFRVHWNMGKVLRNDQHHRHKMQEALDDATFRYDTDLTIIGMVGRDLKEENK